MAGGNWDETALPTIPGLYNNFVNQATAQITGGARGIVGIPVFTYGAKTEAGKFYTFEKEKEVTDVLGITNSKAVLRILNGGSKEVLVYAVPALVVPETNDAQFIGIRNAFEARQFNVFVYPEEVSAIEQDKTVSWVKRNREVDGKHFLFVAGGSAEEDQDSTLGDARSIRLKDDYVANLINGVVTSAGELSSAEYAPAIAGLIAGTPINKSITNQALTGVDESKSEQVIDVTKRLRKSEIKASLAAGSLVLVHDGTEVVVQQGLTTGFSTDKKCKIRIQRGRQAISTDIHHMVSKNYIGKVDNTPAGQVSLIAAIKAYFGVMEKNNVVSDPEVRLDPNEKSIGDKVFLDQKYLEVDSMEYIFIKTNV